MNKLINFLLDLLTNNSDKVFHFLLGSIISFVVILVCTAFGCNHALSIAVSVLVVTGLEMFKEYALDAFADWKDVVATLLGGLMIWVTLIL